MKLIIGFLLAFYAIVLYLVIHPNVSEQYSNYYIKNTTDLTKVDQDRMVNLKLGQIISADTNQIFFDHWTHPKPGIRMSKGNKPAIIFLLDQSEIDHCKCALELTITPLWPQHIDISINGSRYFDEFINQSKTIQIKLDRESLKPGLNSVAFDLEFAKKINFTDRYKSSIEFTAFQLY